MTEVRWCIPAPTWPSRRSVWARSTSPPRRACGCIEPRSNFSQTATPIPKSGHGLAKRFIIGNEVQSHWHWYNLGEMPQRQVVNEYHRALRVAYLASHSIHPGIQLYVSLDHHWSAQMGNNPQLSMSGKYFLETLNAMPRPRGISDWHVAFHPYPENLSNPRTWEDASCNRIVRLKENHLQKH